MKKLMKLAMLAGMGALVWKQRTTIKQYLNLD